LGGGLVYLLGADRKKNQENNLEDSPEIDPKCDSNTEI
jgi:hypothetical protein